MRQWRVGLACILCSSTSILAEHRMAPGLAHQVNRGGDQALYQTLAPAQDCLDIGTAGTGRPAPQGIESKDPGIDIWIPETHPGDPRPQPARCLVG